MAFIIAKMSDGIVPIYISCWAIIDFTKPDWNLDFVMSGFDSKIFKGMKKDELQNIVLRMRLAGTKMNVKHKSVDKTMAEMKDTIEKGWGKTTSVALLPRPLQRHLMRLLLHHHRSTCRHRR